MVRSITQEGWEVDGWEHLMRGGGRLMDRLMGG